MLIKNYAMNNDSDHHKYYIAAATTRGRPGPWLPHTNAALSVTSAAGQRCSPCAPLRSRQLASPHVGSSVAVDLP